MKTKLLCMIAALLLSAAVSHAGFAKQITVFNGTGFTFHGLAVSPGESEQWGEDMLESVQGGVLKPGEGLKINLSGDTGNWDMAVIDDDGQQVEFSGLDFTDYSQVTIHADGTCTLE